MKHSANYAALPDLQTADFLSSDDRSNRGWGSPGPTDLGAEEDSRLGSVDCSDKSDQDREAFGLKALRQVSAAITATGR